MDGLIGRYIGKDFFDYTSLVTYAYLYLILCFLVFLVVLFLFLFLAYRKIRLVPRILLVRNPSRAIREVLPYLTLGT